MLLLPLLLVTSLAANAADVTPESASRVLVTPCPDAKPVVLAFFTEHGFIQAPEHSCPDCFEFKTDALQDAAGHKVAAHKMVQDYVENAPHEKHGFGVWTSYSKPLAKTNLRLTSDPRGCLVSLRFDYSWTVTEVVAAVPKEGNTEIGSSNRRLERQYLDSITVRVMHAP